MLVRLSENRLHLVLIPGRGEFDCPLDRTARIVRWVAVCVFFLIGYVPGAQLGYIHVAGVMWSQVPLLAELDRPSHQFTQKNRARGKR